MYQHILFDLDGTLTDPKVGITSAVAHALKFYGIEVEDLDTLCKFIGLPLADSFMEYYGFDRSGLRKPWRSTGNIFPCVDCMRTKSIRELNSF